MGRVRFAIGRNRDRKEKVADELDIAQTDFENLGVLERLQAVCATIRYNERIVYAQR